VSRILQKYLKTFAEPSPLSDELIEKFEARESAIVIPAYKEKIDFVQRLSKHENARKLLLILVLNEPEHDKGNAQNKDFFDAMMFDCAVVSKHQNTYLLHLDQLQILFIACLEDCALPKKQGVGLARKIGADSACRLYNLGKLKSDWVFNSDADTVLPQTHFQLPKRKNVSAFTHPFQHIGEDNDTLTATLIYEKCLRYYKRQLALAGSPYAFYTLGSTTTFSVEHYTKVRGFPKRAGAEDFYMLNKLAKVGTIMESGDKILITARLSDRVPFGTGPAVTNILEKCHNRDCIRYYAPEIFFELKRVLDAIQDIWVRRNYEDVLSPLAAEALKEAKFDHFLQQRFKQDLSFEQFKKHFHDWFDAFQTLKFVRHLRNHYDDIDINTLST